MSSLGDFYSSVYGALCGVPPHVYPWHFQWLATKDLHADLKRLLPQLRGRVLDVGCGGKPYEGWLERAEAHVGIDTSPGPKVDLVVEPDRPWALDDASFDAVLCTQVLQYVAHVGNLADEINRVLRPGGTLILTVPFAYNQHRVFPDYWRFSVDGVRQIFAAHSDIVEMRRQGGIGSTVGLLTLNWIEAALNHHKPTRLLKGILLPAWLVFCGMVNALGWCLDRIDPTTIFYGNVLLLARKPHPSSRTPGIGEPSQDSGPD